MSIAGDISAELAEEPLRAKIADLEKQRDQLRAVCAEAYQLAGALNAPVEALDNLSAAANCEPLPHATFLPVAVPDVVAQRDELLAALKSISEITGYAGFNVGGPLEHCPGELEHDEAKRLLSLACEYFKDISKAASSAIASVKGGAA